MRALLVLAAIAVIGLALGIISIKRDSNSTVITIDRARLREAASKAISKGEKALSEIEQDVDADESTANRFKSSSSR